MAFGVGTTNNVISTILSDLSNALQTFDCTTYTRWTKETESEREKWKYTGMLFAHCDDLFGVVHLLLTAVAIPYRHLMNSWSCILATCCCCFGLLRNNFIDAYAMRIYSTVLDECLLIGKRSSTIRFAYASALQTGSYKAKQNWLKNQLQPKRKTAKIK